MVFIQDKHDSFHRKENKKNWKKKKAHVNCCPHTLLTPHLNNTPESNVCKPTLSHGFYVANKEISCMTDVTVERPFLSL